ncbi:MAG TPA: DUF6364 family protein [Gemmatimonadaceae bacterium]|nr:DUF6364 family protein [Gemmatimonadaceae bacterium]
MTRSTKRPKNLSLDPEAIARGERYSKLHGTNLSRLVSDFLRSLPLGGAPRPRSPAVRRLRGIAVSRAGKRTVGRVDYREHLYRKYTGK